MRKKEINLTATNESSCYLLFTGGTVFAPTPRIE